MQLVIKGLMALGAVSTLLLAAAQTRVAAVPATPSAAVESGGTPISSLPFRIVVPGHYYLTGDLQGSRGIVVRAHDVTIDLRGFTLTGDLTVPWSGIELVQADNVEIHGGTVRGFGANGIVADLASDLVRVYAVTVLGNGGPGMNLDGRQNRVERCTAEGNLSVGIRIHTGVVSRSTATRNQAAGIDVTRDGLMQENVCVENVNGVNCNENVTIVGNTCVRNVVGIQAGGPRNTIVGNVARDNTAVGIQVGAGSPLVTHTTARENTVSGSTEGFQVWTHRNSVEANHVFDCDVGIGLTGSDNLYTSNRCGDNGVAFGGVADDVDGGGNLVF